MKKFNILLANSLSYHLHCHVQPDGHTLILADFWHLDDPFTAGGQSAEHHNHAVAAKVAVAGRPEHILPAVESMRKHI